MSFGAGRLCGRGLHAPRGRPRGVDCLMDCSIRPAVVARYARGKRQLTPQSISCAVSALPRRVGRSVGSTPRFGRDCWPQGQPVPHPTPGLLRLRGGVGHSRHGSVSRASLPGAARAPNRPTIGQQRRQRAPERAYGRWRRRFGISAGLSIASSSSCRPMRPFSPRERWGEHALLEVVQEGVHGGRTGLLPLREAVAAGASVVAVHVDRLRRAALHDLGLDAAARQGPALE